MGLVARVMLLVRALRDPRIKAPGAVELDARLDEVERRHRLLSTDGANEAQRAIRSPQHR